MESYEKLILELQESEKDDCKMCPYKGKKCKNQCTKEEIHYNPVLKSFMEKYG